MILTEVTAVPRLSDSEEGNVYNVPANSFRGHAVSEKAQQRDLKATTDQFHFTRKKTNSKRERSSQRNANPKPSPPQPKESDVVFSAYSVAGPTGSENANLTLSITADVTPESNLEEVQNPYEEPMQQDQVANNVVFTGYSLARRASAECEYHKYHCLEMPASSGTQRPPRPTSTIQTDDKPPPVVPRRQNSRPAGEQDKPPIKFRKSDSNPELQRYSTTQAISLEPATAKKPPRHPPPNSPPILKRPPIETQLLSPIKKPSKANAPLPPKPQNTTPETTRNPAPKPPTIEPSAGASNKPNSKPNQVLPGPPTLLVVHNPTYFDVVPGNANGTTTGNPKNKQAPPPPKPSTAENKELPKPGHERYKHLPPPILPKTGGPKSHT